MNFHLIIQSIWWMLIRFAEDLISVWEQKHLISEVLKLYVLLPSIIGAFMFCCQFRGKRMCKTLWIIYLQISTTNMSTVIYIQNILLFVALFQLKRETVLFMKASHQHKLLSQFSSLARQCHQLEVILHPQGATILETEMWQSWTHKMATRLHGSWPITVQMHPHCHTGISQQSIQHWCFRITPTEVSWQQHFTSFC